MSDEFFDDEQELMDAAAGGAPRSAQDAGDAEDDEVSGGEGGADAQPADARPPVAGRPPRQAPPFWMVLAIAAISLALGMAIGYLMGSAATLRELSDSPAPSQPQSVGMPEGHPELEVGEDGSAALAGDASGDAGQADSLELANAHFDRGMGMLAAAKDEQAHEEAVEVFRQAVGHYDDYLKEHKSPAAEVDRAICLFYAGDHDEAIAELEGLVADDPTFAPAWANLGMFYEAHGDAAKAQDAYRAALDAAKDEDPYGVAGYAAERLEALGK